MRNPASAPTQPENGLSHRLLSDSEWRAIAADLRLSPREAQIVKCIFDGCKEHAIALELGISPHTVHTHLERLYQKINVTCRCEVALRVFEAFIRRDAARHA